MKRLVVMSAILALSFVKAPAAQADELPFKRPIELYVGSSVGAGYDVYARLLSRHLSKYLPGSPSVLVKNMSGAGGLTLAHWLYKVAPKDGSVIGTFGRGIAFDQLLSDSSSTLDGREFNWLGSMNDEVSVCVATKASGVRSFKDLFANPFTVGASGVGGDTYTFPSALNSILGTKIKIVNGYPGGNEITLALERGEVSGRCGWSWSSLVATHSNMLKRGDIVVLSQLGLSRHPDLPDAPLAQEFAANEEQRSALKLIFARQTMAWPFAAPPGIPKERADMLRKAFQAAMSDPDLLAEARTAALELRPVSGETLDRVIKESYASPAPVIQRAREALK